MSELTEERVIQIVEKRVGELLAVAKAAPKTAKRRPLFKKRVSKSLLTQVIKAVLPENKS